MVSNEEDILGIYALEILANNIRVCSCGKRFSNSLEIKKHLNKKHTFALNVDEKSKQFFFCKQCSRLFSTLNKLLIHSPEHTHEILFTCIECQKNFYVYDEAKRHIEEHKGVSICTNNTMDNASRNLPIMERDEQEEDEESEIALHLNGNNLNNQRYSMPSSNELTAHSSTQHIDILSLFKEDPETPLTRFLKNIGTCSCGKPFTDEKEFLLHIQSDHYKGIDKKGIRAYRCINNCPYSNATLNLGLLGFIAHLNSHSQKLNYFCSKCNIPQIDQLMLRRHLLMHDKKGAFGDLREKKPVNCSAEIVDLSYVYKEDEETPLTRFLRNVGWCVCGEPFVNEEQFLDHIENKHTKLNMKQVKVYYCSNGCPINNSAIGMVGFIAHLNSHNGVRYSCHECGIPEILTHIRIHLKRHKQGNFEYLDKELRTKEEDLSFIYKEDNETSLTRFIRKIGICVCGEPFTTEHEFLNHIKDKHHAPKIMGNKIYKCGRTSCNYHGRAFGLMSFVIHLNSHENGVMYSCAQCTMGKMSSQVLKIHLKKHNVLWD